MDKNLHQEDIAEKTNKLSTSLTVLSVIIGALGCSLPFLTKNRATFELISFTITILMLMATAMFLLFHHNIKKQKTFMWNRLVEKAKVSPSERVLGIWESSDKNHHLEVIFSGDNHIALHGTHNCKNVNFEGQYIKEGSVLSLQDAKASDIPMMRSGTAQIILLNFGDRIAMSFDAGNVIPFEMV